MQTTFITMWYVLILSSALATKQNARNLLGNLVTTTVFNRKYSGFWLMGPPVIRVSCFIGPILKIQKQNRVVDRNILRLIGPVIRSSNGSVFLFLKRRIKFTQVEVDLCVQYITKQLTHHYKTVVSNNAVSLYRPLWLPTVFVAGHWHSTLF